MGSDGSDDGDEKVPPLEHTAYFSIDTTEGYVDIEQSMGDRTLYTPEEARDIADAILDAVEAAEEDR